MDFYLIWVLIGFVLVIVELLTGTFYLLVLGVAAFGAAVSAFAGLPFPLQAATGTVIGAVGSWLVHLYRVRNSQQQMCSIDYAQPVIFETWLDQQAHRARVIYRGAPWEAEVADKESDATAGATLYIIASNGSTLTVSTTRPV
jgi:membrane protein implicated in regulation of membrane protease activity